MRYSIALIVAAIALLLEGCALVGPGALLRGHSQTLAVRTIPPDARCTVFQGGQQIAEIIDTPGTVVAPRRREDLQIRCIKDGYLDEQRHIPHAMAVEVERVEGFVEPSNATDVAPVAIATVAAAAVPSAGMAAATGTAAVAPLAVLGPLLMLPAMLVTFQAANSDFAYWKLPDFVLTPAVFRSETARDAHFASLASALDIAALRARDNVLAICRGKLCDVYVAEVESRRKAEGERLNKLRQETRLRE